ncbi:MULTISPECIES: ATP-dependent protease subunit HslV [Fusobacterium]|jgi:ATP-dependent HslUV protease subunit HslV|uniref:ATP-dependent protease subunit HslV n=1 Tax=Fusobacterium hominis TaxID=2764326 RepID=A0A7G9GYX6_9FUSO|nr:MULTISPECIES: ATP-dependent protease subunit HslV [Fusobacterium]QNM16008.1 ATP-dependent protease subunit HslV [Fusobacterium hominis]
MIKATTIIAVKKDGKVAMAGDGQVTFGDVVFKNNAKKIRKIEKYNVLAGFAGAAADAFALMDKFEAKLVEFEGNLKKSAVELAKEWRTDKALRVLDAMLIVADSNTILILSGNGDVIEPDGDIAAIGSGGNYAYAAARALLNHGEKMTAEDIAIEAMEIAGQICIYTNGNITYDVI